jgi:hypothetical protein
VGSTRLPTVTPSVVPTVHRSEQPTLPTSRPSSSPTMIPDVSRSSSDSALATISLLVHLIWPIIVICIGLLMILCGCFCTLYCVKYKNSVSAVNNDRIINTPTLSSSYPGASESEIDHMPSSAHSSSFAYRTVILNNFDKEGCQPSAPTAPTAPPLSLQSMFVEEQQPVYQLTAIGYNSSTPPVSVMGFAVPIYNVSPVNEQLVAYSTSSAANL